MIKWLNELPEWGFLLALVVAMLGAFIFVILTVYVVKIITG